MVCEGGVGGRISLSPQALAAPRPFHWVLMDSASSHAQHQSPSAFPFLCLEAPWGLVVG